MIDYSAIKKAAENYEKDMTAFLRELIAIPSESAEEEGVAKRIVAEHLMGGKVVQEYTIGSSNV